MALRPVLQFPDPRLKRKSAPVGEITDEIRALAQDMIEVMYDEPGIGLAAPQVGEAIRLIVMDTDWTEEGAEKKPDRDGEPRDPGDATARSPGPRAACRCPTSRPTSSARRACACAIATSTAQEHEEDAYELRAVCFQHEIDHLDGVLFIDRISRLKRSLYVQKRKKALEREEPEPAKSGRAL